MRKGGDEGERYGRSGSWNQVLRERFSISVARFFAFRKGIVLVYFVAAGLASSKCVYSFCFLWTLPTL